MQIETYEIEEVPEQLNDEANKLEALELIEKLELDGQKNLFNKKKGNIIPYQEMTSYEVKVYETIFPQKTEVKKYTYSPIPIRVLQVIAHAIELFPQLEIWHKRMKSPDPILVGILNPKSYSEKHYFLLARWGDALENFKILAKEALEQKKEEWKNLCLAKQKKAEVFLLQIEENIRKYFNDEYVDLP